MNSGKAAYKIETYIALGSNVGNRSENLNSAIQSLSPLVMVLDESPIYQTAPWGFENQPAFLNQVILAKTNCSPLDLLAHLKEIETIVGRTPTFKYGPREVDLDILFYGDLIFEHPKLQIPHPKLQERAFVLVPLNDLNPNLKHPITGQTVHEILSQLDVSGITPFYT